MNAFHSTSWFTYCISQRTRCAFLALLCSCLPAMALAQTSLSGTVTNTATGRALEGARVALDGLNRDVLTDRQGNFRFDDLAPGSVTVAVSYTGLDPVNVP